MSWSGFWWLDSSSSKPLHFFNLLPNYRPAAQRSVLELTYCWCPSEGNSLCDACGLCGVGANWGGRRLSLDSGVLSDSATVLLSFSTNSACRFAALYPQSACTPCVSTRRLTSLEFYNNTKPPAVIAEGNAAFVTTVINLEHDFC
jgi:hypothetical protein